MSDFSSFLEIRRVYSTLLPEWMAEYEATGDIRQDPYFMDWVFTPIENSVWSDIRTLGLPFFPQVPALNYFIDFACPMLKIGIECDGKAWHDSDLDAARDARLAADGWMIFRIEGHECKRIVEAFPEYEEEDPEMVEKFFMSTSEGVMSAIKRKYFDDLPYGENEYLMEKALFNHRSTPETYPVRRAITKKSEPVLAADSVAGYIERLLLLAQREAA